MSDLFTQLGALIQSAWEEVQPAVANLWILITTDPLSALSALVIIGVLIWAYQQSTRLGR